MTVPTTAHPTPRGTQRRAGDPGIDRANGQATDLAAVTLAALSGPPRAVVEQPARPGVTADWPHWVPESVRGALHGIGVERPWQHQVEAADLAWSGRHVVIATGTASGKSLAYWLPALSAAVTGRATTLYCTPTKALAADQQARLDDLGLPGVMPACFDGDTPREVRQHLLAGSRFLLTNPDMLHRTLLPGHTRWRPVLARLRFVVLDESHLYRGVFGANVAAVVTRLRRLAALAGADPTFIVSSATLGAPAESAAALIGVAPDRLTAVTRDTARRPARTVILHDPADTHDAARTPDPADPPPPGDRPPPPSAFDETAAALTAWHGVGAQSVGFVRSRAGVEAMAQAVARRTGDPDRAAPYRGGLLPEERRAIEQGLRSGALRTVAATNALELGVDITGLDAVAMCGWPGTRLSFLQQLGRAGRAGRPAVALLTAAADPLDRYYAADPRRVLDAGLEAVVFDRDNPHVLLGHLACAVAEHPLTDAEATTAFGPQAATVLSVLAARGLVRRRGERWFWVAPERPGDLVDLRGTGGQVSIVEAGTGRVLGSLDAGAAPAHLHPGAVYTHWGVTHLIESLDLDAGVAVARRDSPGYTTVAQSVSRVSIEHQDESRPLGAGTVHTGRVSVTAQVVGFLRRCAATGRVLGSEPLDLPPRTLTTVGVWWTLPAEALVAADVAQVPGAAHAAEHAAIGVLPAIATCDRWDIGGLSTEFHADTGCATVFVYDGHPGGAGFARRGYQAVREWLTATYEVIRTCECTEGCPGCVQSPKCGNGNSPLDKHGALRLLGVLLD